MKHEKLKEFLNPDAMKRLCRDYVLEHEDLTILSWDYVIEHGRDWDNEDSIGWDSYGYRVCDITDEGEIPITGLLYQLYADNSLWWYGYYIDGLCTGPDVTFFPSGELRQYGGYEWYETGQIKSYSVILKNAGVWESYEWYESGVINKYSCRNKRGFGVKYIEYDESGNITKEITD